MVTAVGNLKEICPQSVVHRALSSNLYPGSYDTTTKAEVLYILLKIVEFGDEVPTSSRGNWDKSHLTRTFLAKCVEKDDILNFF